jgi:all-trans-retinol 13,14-reductase
LIALEDVNGDRFFADKFVSNIHPAQTLRMIDPTMLRKPYRNRITSLKNTISCFNIYGVLKEKTFPYINYNYYYYKRDNVWSLDYYHPRNWPENFFFYTPAVSNDEKFANCIGIATYMQYDEVKKWEDTTVGNRGADYTDWKKSKAEIAIGLVSKYFPDLEKNITRYYTSSPLTYRDYIGNCDGALYGIQRNCDNPLESVILPRSIIPNLFFTGQNISLHGMLGVSISAIVTAGEFVGLEHLINSINNA